MKIINYKKCKFLIQLTILILPYFFSYARLNLIHYYLKNEYIQIEEYLKKCNSFGTIEPKKNISITNPKISIITPVYNTEKYILRLIRSIQYQDFNHLEIILIDDFSKDNCVKLIKKYQKEDRRIKLITNKKHKGTFSCRNIGIMKSKGFYIILPDSDDILLENSINYFYNFAIKYNYEFVRFNIYLNYGKSFFGNITEHLTSRPIYKPELSTYIFYGLGYLLQVDYNVCNKIIKRETLIKALNTIDNIYLRMYMSYYEDGLLNYMLYRTAKSSYFSKRFGYYYIRNNYKPLIKYSYFDQIKCKFIHIMNVFNFSKNTKYEKDMTNEIFKRIIFGKKEMNYLNRIKKEFNFFINAIDVLLENEFFLNKYKKYLIYLKNYFYKRKKKIYLRNKKKKL